MDDSVTFAVVTNVAADGVEMASLAKTAHPRSHVSETVGSHDH